ncbi:MAG TPA: dTDP-4-dehydrorhamnose reductase [Methylophilaceae bacterium]
MRKILLTGATGQVGFELRRTLAPLGQVIALSSQQLNLVDADAIRRTVRDIDPQLIVNAAAYTAVDKAETELDLAMTVNSIAPGVLAEEAQRRGAGLVHFSTDYVFDGTKPDAYVETDSPNPTSAYGASKLAGERAIQTVGVPHLIFRTSWVYGARGKNFLLTILRLAKERDNLRIVADQIGAPTWSRMIAEATALAVAQWCPVANHQTPLDELSGIYHLTNGGETSWHGFAQSILREYRTVADWPPLLATPLEVAAITTEQYPLPAKRPANSVLNNAKLRRAFRLQLPEWQEALPLVLQEAATLAI